ncbi:hypothetical protein [Streptomyces arboris]|uniref:hypothetical protein n=1 Tax=Streptomyces arboris TaxID=2600619 RepID=UPI00362C0885
MGRDGGAPGARRLHRTPLRRAIERLRRLPAADRARLPGISAARSAQILADAIVAETAMRTMGSDGPVRRSAAGSPNTLRRCHAGSVTVGEAGRGMRAMGAYWAAWASNMAA